ncbi:MAG TPA: hypothetical protein DEV81_26955 [Cyanobacteria bacterium UBA11049]|nr:hypothetical protein [Cyanobacteria bacterium UBA11049]
MNMKSSVFYPVVIFASVLGVVGFLLLAWLQFTVRIEPVGSDVALLPEKKTLLPESPSSDAAVSSSAEPIAQAKPLPSVKQETPAEPSPQSPNATAISGALRVSNQTEQPLRVALLTRSPNNSSATNKPKFGEPVHWDFAPGEGSSQGLVLSLPEGNLKLHKGDVIVAFAQDGSRRYWGPYVVGETDAPVLNRKTSEWQLILQP